MTTITIAYPTGNQDRAVNLATVTDFVENSGRYYTALSCGEATFEYSNNVVNCILGVRFVENLGHSFEYTKKLVNTNQFDKSLISCSPGCIGDAVVTYVGGMSMLLPSGSFKKYDTSVAIIWTFVETGDLLAPSTWMLTDELSENAYDQ